MSKTQQNDILRDLFVTVMNSSARESPVLESRPTALDSPHPMDDEDLLLDWSAGDLPAERHEQLLDHLAACPACRREIAAMVRAGALVLPDVEASLRDENPGVGETEPRGAWQRPASGSPNTPRDEPSRRTDQHRPRPQPARGPFSSIAAGNPPAA